MRSVIPNALEQFDVIALGAPTWWGFFTNIIVFVGLTIWVYVLFGASASRSYRGLLFESQFSISFNISRFLRSFFRENLSLEKDIYFYFLVSVLGLILLSNLIGMIPYAVTTTSFVVMTFFFSCTGFVASLCIGLWVHGWRFFGLFVPAGTPTALKIALVFIECVSYFARLFSLAIRLFANMMAGHALLKILSGFGWSFLVNLTASGIAAACALAIIWAVTVLELLIAFLQAYVFIVLTCIYLNEAVNLH